MQAATAAALLDAGHEAVRHARARARLTEVRDLLDGGAMPSPEESRTRSAAVTASATCGPHVKSQIGRPTSRKARDA